MVKIIVVRAFPIEERVIILNPKTYTKL